MEQQDLSAQSAQVAPEPVAFHQEVGAAFYDDSGMISKPTPELFEALAAFQGACPDIPKDTKVKFQSKKGGTIEYNYAPLGTILKKIRPVLAKHGLSVLHMPVSENRIRCMVCHHSGGYLIGEAFAFNYDDQDVKAFGSIITYLRRYTLEAMLGICSQDDDDGEAASQKETRLKLSAKAMSEALTRIGNGDVNVLELAQKHFDLTETQEKQIRKAYADQGIAEPKEYDPEQNGGTLFDGGGQPQEKATKAPKKG